MPTLAPVPKLFFLDNNGRPLVGGQLFTYEAGTSTKIETFSDQDGTPNTNPVILDYRGEADVWIDGELSYKFVLAPRGDTDPPTNPIWSVDNVSAGLLQFFIDTPPWARTETEIAAGAQPVHYPFQPIPEDVRRYGADYTDGDAGETIVAIQATVDSQNAGTIKGGVIWFPGDANSIYNLGDQISIPKRASGDNHTRWYKLIGMGRGSPRIVADSSDLIDNPMIDASGTNDTTYSFYREFCDFYLNGAGIAQRGVELFYNQHFRVENLFITALDDGTSSPSGAAGVRVFGAISSQFRDIKVHNSQGYGILASAGSGNFFNANLVEGCSFLDVDVDGFYASGGWSGNCHIGNTHEFCGNYGMRLAGYSGTCGFIGGNYLESNFNGDFYIGEETTANSVVIEGNYLNGYTNGVSDTDYTPIRIKFADGVIIRGNMVAVTTKSTTGYLILDANISGGSVQNCIIEDNQVRSLASTTAPNTIYNLPGSWVDSGNSCHHPTFVPCIESNLIRRQWPFGGWTLTTSGSGTATYEPSRPLMGAASLRLVRPAASTASASQAFALETGSPYKNRFVTLSVPVRANVGSSSLTVALAPNGTSPQTTTIDVNTLGANEERIVYVMAFAPSDATTLTVTITANATSADFDVGMPCLYVGAKRWYSNVSENDSGGTWTPVIGGSTSETGQSYTTQVGTWIRNGAMISCFYDVTLSNKGTITGSVVIKGLPVAGVSTASQGLPGMVTGFISNLATNWVSVGGYVEPQNSRCFLTGFTAAAAGQSFFAAADIGNTTRISGSFHYLVNG